MKTPRLDAAIESGRYNTIQLLEIAATELPSGNLRDLLLGSAKLHDKQKNTLTKALEVVGK